jgi:hypothetical protein
VPLKRRSVEWVVLLVIAGLLRKRDGYAGQARV